MGNFIYFSFYENQRSLSFERKWWNLTDFRVRNLNNRNKHFPLRHFLECYCHKLRALTCSSISLKQIEFIWSYWSAWESLCFVFAILGFKERIFYFFLENFKFQISSQEDANYNLKSKKIFQTSIWSNE